MVTRRYAPLPLTILVGCADPNGSFGAAPHDSLVAVCSADLTYLRQPFQTTATLAGGGQSGDGTQAAIEVYDWLVTERPAGSAATVEGEAVATLTPDVPGDYVVELVVMDDTGAVSEPCTVAILAGRPSALMVTLEWSIPDDFNLHIVRGGGAFLTSQDCFAGNCILPDTLDWGAAGDPTDNPQLAADVDVGHEDTTIEAPPDAVYHVRVSDIGTVVYEGENEATVEIRVDGALVYAASKVFSGEGDGWSGVEFAAISWPDRTVTPR